MWPLWVGSEGYFAGLDKQLAGIQQRITALENGQRRRDQIWSSVRSRFLAASLSFYFVILAYATWVMRQPPGTYSSVGHAKRVAPLFVFPFMAYLVHRTADQLRILLNRRSNSNRLKLKNKLRKMVGDLKDSTRYLKTQQLLQKYDPDRPQAHPPNNTNNDHKATIRSPSQQKERREHQADCGKTNETSLSSPVKSSKILTAATGAGMALSSALGQIFTQAADTLIADDPMLISMLDAARSRAEELELENAKLRQELHQLRNNGIVDKNQNTPPHILPSHLQLQEKSDFAFGSPVHVDEQQPTTDDRAQRSRLNGQSEDVNDKDGPSSPTCVPTHRHENNRNSNTSIIGGDGCR